MTVAVGLIGTGLMGKPMGANLLKKGFPLTVWNRTAGKTDDLVRAGAKKAKTPSEVAQMSDVILSIVSDPPALEEVYWGPHGVMEGLSKRKIVIDSSTVSPELARRAAAACEEKGVEFLDAPVTGGTWGAESGDLVFMIGGSKNTFERAKPVLSAMGKNFFLLGPNGAGQTIKLAMNLILALEVEAFAEALALVQKAGVSGHKLFEVMQSSMARAGVLDVKGPAMITGEFKTSFPLRLMHKDVRLARELASQLEVSLPAGDGAFKAYDAVQTSSKDDPDYAAVTRYWQHSKRA